jgi:putative flippase GtrA
MFPSQYARFLAVGALVGGVTVGLRELIARLLAVDSAWCYSLSVVLAYLVGIVLSYILNRRLTFRQVGASTDPSAFAFFAAIALLGTFCTWAFSLLLRYGAHFNALLGGFAAAAAFALAAVISTLITYPLNARFVFRPDRRQGLEI